MNRIQVKPAFVRTDNVRMFETLMNGLDLSHGEGRLGLVFGRAGRGKTRTAQWYAAHHAAVYLRMATVWNTSPTEFLRSLCHELGSKSIPRGKGRAYAEVLDLLTPDPRPIFLDEIEKMPQTYLDLVRDLSDVSAAPFILVGEEELTSLVKRNRRVWSRIYHSVEFAPITISDILSYAREASGITLPEDIVKIVHDASGGDFRLVRRAFLILIQQINANGNGGPTVEMAKSAVKMGTRGGVR